jgi:hypothetical protein
VDDREIVERQIGRRPRALLRVAARCPWGRPAVTEQAPFDEHGEPFPTTYYLTCPQLVAALARVEAAGGVDRWTRAVEGDAELRASLAAANDEQLAVRRGLAGGRDGPGLDRGVGGSSRTGSLKCLHAHAAFALARPGYELGERILAEVTPLWPQDRCCTDL